MKKLLSMVLALILVGGLFCGAYAETAFTMAGYDHEDTGRVWTDNLFFQRMEEKTGIHFDLTQYTTSAAWQKAKADMLAGTAELPDALFKADLTTAETTALLQAGKIIDLKPYMEEYAPNLWALLQQNETWLEAITLPTGEIAALPAIDELQFNNAMWINKTWLAKAGLDMPTTADELTEVLRVFRDKDMNGNGKKNDEVPLTFSSMWDLRFLAHAFGINANDYYVTMDDDGTVREILTTEENRAFLNWLHQLWEEDLLDDTGFSGLRSLNVNTDKDAEIVYGVMFSSTPAELVPTSALRDYVLLDPLVYEGKQVYRDLTGDVIRGTFAITSACADPATLLTWVDFLYTEEGFILAEAGAAGEKFTWNDDGTWLWEAAGSTQLSAYLTESTVRSGITMPGYASIPFQQKIDDASTAHVVEQLLRLRSIDSLPYPLVYLTEDQQTRLAELIWDIGKYAEQQMVWFVTGDADLTDDTWQEFCAQVKHLGVDEMVAILQTAANEQQ